MCVLLHGSLQLLLIITYFVRSESPRPMLFIYGEVQVLEGLLAPHTSLTLRSLTVHSPEFGVRP